MTKDSGIGAAGDPAFFARAEWFRDWLSEHHDTAGELLVGFWKVGAGRHVAQFRRRS